MFPFIRLLNARRSLVVRQAFSLPDLAVVILVLAAILVVGQLSQSPVNSPAAALGYRVSLEFWGLPLLAARSTFRFVAGLALSFVFAVFFGTVAARVKSLEAFFVSLLDVLQSVPVLAFIAASATFFINAFPHSAFGLECLSIFAAFSSQAWNMGFSYYQSLKGQPRDLDEAVTVFRLDSRTRFFRLDLPSGAIGLVWNAMLSFGGGWFFVAYSESVTINDRTYVLPGLGSYLAEAVREKNVGALVAAILTMVAVLLTVDQLFWRPLVAWSERYRLDRTGNQAEPARSWFLDLLIDARLPKILVKWLGRFLARLPKVRRPQLPRRGFRLPVDPGTLTGIVMGLAIAFGSWQVFLFLRNQATMQDLVTLSGMAGLTFARVAVVVVISSLIWVPIGVTIGLNTQLAKRVMPFVLLLSAFPTNFVFPIVTWLFLTVHMNIDYGSTLLLMLGAQWYVLFNVIAGASAIPSDMREMARSTGLKGWNLWRSVYLPAVFPSWVAGAVTASGGAWNASIVCEYVKWGDDRVMRAHGLGSYITQMSEQGAQGRVLLGAAVMCVFVVVTNRLAWQRLSNLAETRYGMV